MADTTDGERITGVEEQIRALKELIEVRFSAMEKALSSPAPFNWTAFGVCLSAIAMVCAGGLVWLKTNLQPLEMNVAANDKRIESVRAECVREHQWNWDGHKQRIDTISKQQERQEALIRLLLGERIEAYEKRANTGRD